MPHASVYPLFRTVALILALVGPCLSPAAHGQGETALEPLPPPPSAAEITAPGLDLHGDSGSMNGGIDVGEASLPPIPSSPPVLMDTDTPTPITPEAEPREVKSNARPEVGSRISAEIEAPVEDSADLALPAPVEEPANEPPPRSNAPLLYVSLFVGFMALLLVGLTMALSQQSRRSRKRKRRRKADLPLKQRMAVSGPRKDVPEAELPDADESVSNDGRRIGGGPRRVAMRNGTPTIVKKTPPQTADLGPKPDPREEFGREFEHLLRMSRLREGDSDAPLDRMTLSEMHMHYSALLRIVPSEARQPLVDSIEALMRDLRAETPTNPPGA